MDLQKLRPTKSQWAQPRLTTEEARKRVAQRPITVSASKALSEPPKGKGGELWQKFYTDAVARKHPDPEKLADTLGLTERLRSIPIVEPDASHAIGLVVPDHDPMPPLLAALVAEAKLLANKLKS